MTDENLTGLIEELIALGERRARDEAEQRMARRRELRRAQRAARIKASIERQAGLEIARRRLWVDHQLELERGAREEGRRIAAEEAARIERIHRWRMQAANMERDAESLAIAGRLARSKAMMRRVLCGASLLGLSLALCARIVVSEWTRQQRTALAAGEAEVAALRAHVAELRAELVAANVLVGAERVAVAMDARWLEWRARTEREEQDEARAQAEKRRQWRCAWLRSQGRACPATGPSV